MGCAGTDPSLILYRGAPLPKIYRYGKAFRPENPDRFKDRFDLIRLLRIIPEIWIIRNPTHPTVSF
jgi:hypothetical protein